MARACLVRMHSMTLLACGSKQHFEGLSSEETHRLFEKFAKKWNAGELDRTYYT